jgi:hypothetical protein
MSLVMPFIVATLGGRLGSGLRVVIAVFAVAVFAVGLRVTAFFVGAFFSGFVCFADGFFVAVFFAAGFAFAMIFLLNCAAVNGDVIF